MKLSRYIKNILMFLVCMYSVTAFAMEQKYFIKPNELIVKDILNRWSMYENKSFRSKIDIDLKIFDIDYSNETLRRVSNIYDAVREISKALVFVAPSRDKIGVCIYSDYIELNFYYELSCPDKIRIK